MVDRSSVSDSRPSSDEAVRSDCSPHATVFYAAKGAIEKFDKSLPGLVKMRNVGEHVEAYAVDDPGRHYASIDHSQLQVGCFDGTVYNWLGNSINIDDGLQAAEELFR